LCKEAYYHFEKSRSILFVEAETGTIKPHVLISFLKISVYSRG